MKISSFSKKNPTERALCPPHFRYILVSVAGVLSAMVTLLQKYKLMKVNAWTLNLYIGLLGATVTGTISLATEDITFPTDIDNIIYITIQVNVQLCSNRTINRTIQTNVTFALYFLNKKFQDLLYLHCRH